MSALASRGAFLRTPGSASPLIAVSASILGASAGVLLRSTLLMAIVASVVAVWAVRSAPELLLVLLATQGTLKSLWPFDAVPVDLLPLSVVLVLASCALRVRRAGLPRLPAPSILMILLALFLFAAATRGVGFGGAYKAIYFSTVVLTLFFAPFFVFRDDRAIARLCGGLVGVGAIVAFLATPGADPSQPLTLPGGNEITAGLFPAVAGLACLFCLAQRSIRMGMVFVPLGILLLAGSARAGSRGVLVASVGACLVGIILVVIHAKRPAVTLGVALVVLAGVVGLSHEIVSQAALARYERVSTDHRRAYLRQRALDQALASPFGTGIGYFGTNSPVLRPTSSVPLYPHNVALEVFNESGVFALGALIGLLVCAMKRALKLAVRRGWTFCAVGLSFALIEAFASGSVNDNTLLWLMTGVSLASIEAMAVSN